MSSKILSDVPVESVKASQFPEVVQGVQPGNRLEDKLGYVVKSTLNVSAEFSNTIPLDHTLFKGLVDREVEAQSRALQTGQAAGIVESKIGPDVVENKILRLEDIARSWSTKFVNYIQQQIMDGVDNIYIGSIIDPTEIFVSKCYLGVPLSIDDADEFGFIISSADREAVKQRPATKVRPLFVRCYGVTSGDTEEQIIEATRVLMGLKPRALELADELVKAAICQVKVKYEDENNIIVPFITGHSLGGMFANSLAVKNRFGSMCFNQLGLGQGAVDFVGNENWQLALTTESRNHISLSTERDFVSSEFSPIRMLVKTPGMYISVENTFKEMDPIKTHCEYSENFRNAIDRLRADQDEDAIESRLLSCCCGHLIRFASKLCFGSK